MSIRFSLSDCFFIYFFFFLVVTISNFVRLIGGNESIVINKIQ